MQLNIKPAAEPALNITFHACVCKSVIAPCIVPLLPFCISKSAVSDVNPAYYCHVIWSEVGCMWIWDLSSSRKFIFHDNSACSSKLQVSDMDQYLSEIMTKPNIPLIEKVSNALVKSVLLFFPLISIGDLCEILLPKSYLLCTSLAVFIWDKYQFLFDFIIALSCIQVRVPKTHVLFAFLSVICNTN